MDGIRLLRELTHNEIMICGAVACPFSAATILRGLMAGLIDMYRAPEVFRRLMDVGLEVARVYVEVQLDAGAYAIWVGDCMASSILLGGLAESPSSLWMRRIRSVSL